MKKSKYYDLALNEVTRRGGNPKRAFEWLERAHTRGDSRAAYAIATWYIHGKENVVIQDPARAIPLLREAAKDNHSAAAFDLAVSYERGNGVKKDEAGAFLFYLKAALLGDKQAVYAVGRCYWHGLGITRNRPVAKVWLDRAAALGVTE